MSVTERARGIFDEDKSRIKTAVIVPLTPLDPYTLTDVGNAQRFADAHSGYVRYCKTWKKWLIFDGTRWVIDDTDRIMRLARETVRSIYTEAAKSIDSDERKALADHARRSESEARLRSMVSLAQSEVGIPVAPQQLDADPMKFNVLNGTVDLLTGELLPHNHRDLITKISPVAFNSEAITQTWDTFLKRIFGENQVLIRFLQRAVGYSLTGSVVEQCIFLVWGTGANGKSTFIEALRALFGDYAMSAAFSTFTLKGEGVRNDIARLKGARMVSATEGSDGQRLDEALTKQLTGGDTIAARYLYAEYFEFKMTGKIWLATNHKPRIKETGNAIWRRIRLVPFTVTIPDDAQDKELPSKLLAESSGILNWLIDGCLAWRREGLGIPDEVREATEGYRNEEDPLSDFIDECCVTGSSMEASASSLYQAYAGWAERNGERPMPKRTFGTMLLERGFDQHKGSKGKRFWIGLGLKHEE